MRLRRISTLAAFVLTSVTGAQLAFAPSAARAQSCHRGCRQHCCDDCTDARLEEGEPGPDDQAADPDFDFDQFAATPQDSFVAPSSAGGYIDPAVIRSRVRFRYDSFWGVNFPDRAEFNFAAPPAIGGRARAADNELDYQELTTYAEIALLPRFSIFGEFPARFVDGAIARDPISGEAETHQGGAGDFRAGLRFGIIARPDAALTAQVRAFAPTGDPRRCLGTGHSAIEVGLLYQKQQSDRLTIFSEIREWEAINAFVVGQDFIGGAGSAGGGGGVGSGGGFSGLQGSNAQFIGQRFGGSVLRYGGGLGYDIWRSCDCCSQARLQGVFEIVGWTVLDGLMTDDTRPIGPSRQPTILDADNDVIINGKYGIRYTTYDGRISSYLGYGSNWTSDRWYSDVLRLEVTYNFR